MFRNTEARSLTSSSGSSSVVSSTTSLKKGKRCRSFHFRYFELCRAKNLPPLPDIRKKNFSTSVLDFYGDKFGVTDWLLLEDALSSDQVLHTLNMKLRKPRGGVIEHLDTEKKAKLFQHKPVIYTKFIFGGMIDAVANCIQCNKNLKVLCLEGLPLGEKYVESIAKAMSSNESIREVSFQRSNITDNGCEAVCNTIKYLDNVETLNLSECGLTAKATVAVADMIMMQRISRNTDGWQKSLRYQDVDPDSIPGLHTISLACNPEIGDDGVQVIVDILKDDVWMKVIDMNGCGLTDRAANLIIDCLEVNNYLIDFNVRGNPGISKLLQENIREQLGKTEDDEGLFNDQGAGQKPKVTLAQLKEESKILDDQLELEREMRKKAEQLNGKLNRKIVDCEGKLEAASILPDGYVVVKDVSIETLMRERDDFQQIAIGVCNGQISPLQQREKHQKYLAQYHAQLAQNQNVNSIELDSDSGDNTVNDQQKILTVRQVKSEMKYVDPPVKVSTIKKKSKSDHEFANETDFQLTTVRFETNIGDSITNRCMSLAQQQTMRASDYEELKPGTNRYMSLAQQQTMRASDYEELKPGTNRYMSLAQQQTMRASDYEELKPGPNKYMSLAQQQTMRASDYEEPKPGPSNSKVEMDDLFLGTSRSMVSETFSSESDTIRNVPDFCQPSPKLFTRRKERGQGDGHTKRQASVSAKSPRSLFMGL